MSVASIKSSDTVSIHSEFSFVTTKKSVSEILRLAKSKDSSISVYISDNTISFTMNDRLLYSRREARKAVDWRRGLQNPEKQSTIFFSTGEARDAADRVRTTSNKGHIGITVKDGEMILQGRSEDGESEERIPAEGDYSVAINSDYFIDALNVIEQPTCCIQFIADNPRSNVEITGAHQPCVRIAIAPVESW